MKYLLPFLLVCYFQFPAAAQDELPAVSKNRAAFFISDSVIRNYQLERGQKDNWMIVYNNLNEGAKIQRVNDIRWEAVSAEKAQEWFRDHKKLLGEEGKEITGQLAKPAGVDEWNVYGANEKLAQMMKDFGIKQNHYCFTFTVDQYVAKIFVAASEETSLEQAWQLAKEGLRATLKAAGKTKLAQLLL